MKPRGACNIWMGDLWMCKWAGLKQVQSTLSIFFFHSCIIVYFFFISLDDIPFLIRSVWQRTALGIFQNQITLNNSLPLSIPKFDGLQCETTISILRSMLAEPMELYSSIADRWWWCIESCYSCKLCLWALLLSSPIFAYHVCWP